MKNFVRSKPKSNKAIFLFICFMGLMTASIGLSAQQPQANNPSKSCLWVIETPSNRVFLLGSLHVLKSDAYPLAAEIDRAYALSQRLVFETDLEAMMNPAIQSKMMNLGVYPEGQDLFQNISENTRLNVEKKLKELGLSPAHFSRFKPWFLAVSLATLELQRMGFNPLYGIDIHFYNKAKADEKELGYLESAEYQLDLLGKMDARDQRAFLDQTLKDLDVAARLAGDMVAAWQRGDADKLHALLFKSFEAHPNIEDRILTRRNKDWIPKIEAMLGKPQNTMVIVGAGHLIGPEGIVQLLKQKGYQVKQK
jgi:uncharacterized protein YbaP (TraB family)